MAAAAKKTAATSTAAKKSPATKSPAKKSAATKAAAQRRTSSATSDGAFTADEKAAMKEAARERRAQKAGSDGLADALAKIAAMADADRVIAEKVHALVLAAAPELETRTWYGMPAYAKDGKVVCFFQDAAKFKARYCTLGFQDPARLDEGSMWATSFAITAITKADEKRITDLVRRAVG